MTLETVMVEFRVYLHDASRRPVIGGKPSEWAVVLITDVESRVLGLCHAVLEDFVKRVNSRAEANMLRTGHLEGMHKAALDVELPEALARLAALGKEE